ncbi:hypothetical protein ABPG72_011318 [Tetrahymena utriculariae]
MIIENQFNVKILKQFALIYSLNRKKQDILVIFNKQIEFPCNLEEVIIKQEEKNFQRIAAMTSNIVKAFQGLNNLTLKMNSSLFNKQQYFATKMQASSTQNGRDSIGRRLGIKKFGGEEVFPDDILARQRGFKWHAGKNTYVGKDHTIHSKVEGHVRFEKKYTDTNRKVVTVHVEPGQVRNQYNRPPPPFVYHPELYPERAVNNPAPTNFQVYKQTVKKVKRTDFRGIKIENENRSVVQIPQTYLEQQNHWNVKMDYGKNILQAMQKLESKLLGISYEPIIEDIEGEKEAEVSQQSK